MSYENLRKGRFSEAGGVYFVTCVLANRSTKLFENFALARILVKEMEQLHDEGDVYSVAWVVMPDHMHWLFHLQEQKVLSGVVKALKACSARKINQTIGHVGPIWQKAYYDHGLRSEEDIRDTARYIVANPLRGGLVKQIADYPHWDACWL